jgi:hypothetical protein
MLHYNHTHDGNAELQHAVAQKKKREKKMKEKNF